MENRRIVERYTEALSANDWEALAELQAPGFVEEWPQSGDGDTYTYEGMAAYPNGESWHIVAIMHLRDGKVARSTTYFAPPLEAPEWRASWVERMEDQRSG